MKELGRAGALNRDDKGSLSAFQKLTFKTDNYDEAWDIEEKLRNNYELCVNSFKFIRMAWCRPNLK